MSKRHEMNPASEQGLNFIERIILQDLSESPGMKLKTRFPPEPNGYLHLGHAKSIALNFGLAQKYGGTCNLRMDDTNPSREERVYVESMKEDVAWLGYRWDAFHHASDYFEVFYAAAISLIKQGLAYVDYSSTEAIAAMRGSLTEPGIPSPYRERPIEENLRGFESMKAGEYQEGQAVLRAKIDMGAGNLVLRDPVLYRIKFGGHPHRGQEWVIYPMYDFAHCISDAIEGITHSLCTLEFQDNRALYDWILDHLDFQARPRQYEFSKLNLEGTVLSKRKLNEWVESGAVAGWSDPRLPTLSGLRNRGVPPEAIRLFCSRLGISKQDNALIEAEAFNSAIREVLNLKAPRGFSVLKPLKLTLVNLPKSVRLMLPRHPSDASMGKRTVELSPELWISEDDFQETPSPGFKRLCLGGVVRLRYAYVIRLLEVIKDEQGKVIELLAEADLDSLGQSQSSLGSPKGVIHWLSQKGSAQAEFRVYGSKPSGKTDNGELRGLEFNLASCTIYKGFVCQVVLEEIRTSLFSIAYQFEREGYFYYEKGSELPLFHRTVDLKQSKF